MDKRILVEINRTREIMGLKQLLTEARNYPVKDSGSVRVDKYDKINKTVKKRTKYTNGIVQIPGYKEIYKIFNGSNIPASTQGGSGLQSSKVTVVNVISSLVQHLGGGNMDKGIKEFVEGLKADKTLQTTTTAVPVNKYPKSTETLTRGRVDQLGVTSDKKRHYNYHSMTRSMVRYMNGFNLRSYANDGTEYDISEMDSNGYLDFISGPNDTGGGPLIVYATQYGSEQTADTGIETGKTKGYEATGRYETDYESGDSTPNADLVAKAVKEILVMFPESVVDDIGVFTLEAGASANWGKGTVLPDSNGIGQNFSGEEGSNERKNQELAFNRGNLFMQAVNQGLKDNDHPAFNNYEVEWVVKGQNTTDQYIDLLLDVDKKDIITTKIIPTVISGEKETKTASHTITMFDIDFDYPA